MTSWLEPRPDDSLAETSEELPGVLIVDDVEANLVALRSLLDAERCSITSASSGEDALRLLLRKSFAVILLDVEMPDMDGHEVARLARMSQATRDIPIIFLTASLDAEEHVGRAYGSGAVDFLRKPLDAHVLRSKVRVFLELSRSRQRLAEANRELAEKNRELAAFAEAEASIASSLRQANGEIQAAYRELQAAQAQLVQSAKMASLGELVAGVAHEINNPLAFVMSHLDTIAKSLASLRGELPDPATPRAEEQWKRISARLGQTQNGLGRIRDLVLKLRTFSRLDEGDRKLVSISECVDSVLTILGHRLKDRVRVELDLRPPDRLDCYPSLLNQVLLNLVANSVDAIEGPGTVRIGAGASPERDRFVITVADTGCGIPREVRDRVLEPFFTTKPVGQGTGLGLSIAFSIVRKHEGTLELTDAPGGGTLATITLPLPET
ncbi:MAG: hybrid sensor histidine kinase/response regulator [Polyangiaceae bacterium]|nr:hybrid sensor histidine kinase/response regulator [Polyangiaceae bacterium]